MPVYAELHGGLGNQFSTLAAAYSVARISKLPLVVNDGNNYSSADSDQTIDARISDFVLTGISNNLEGFRLSTGGFKPQVKYLRLKSSLAKRLKFQNYLESGDYEVNGQKRNLEIIRYLSSHYEGTDFPLLARTLGFPRHIKLVQSSGEFRELSEIQSIKSIIGIHVRLGDFKNWHGGLYLTSKSYFDAAISEALRKFPSSEIWLFSDQPDEAVEFLNLKSIQIISGNFELNASDEFMLLSQCKVIINSKSSFSWWASFFSGENSIIYSPLESSLKLGWKFISEI